MYIVIKRIPFIDVKNGRKLKPLCDMVIGGGCDSCYDFSHNMQFSLIATVEGFHIQPLHIILPRDCSGGENALHDG